MATKRLISAPPLSMQEQEKALADIEAAIEKARYILEFEKDWDDDGALPISKTSWDRAVALLRQSAEHLIETHQLHLPPPMIAPMPEGNVTLYWYDDVRHVIIDIPNDDSKPFTYAGKKGSARIKGSMPSTASSDEVLSVFLWLAS